ELSASGRQRPAELDRIVRRCLEKNPAQRFPSARELAAALKAVSQGAAGGSGRQRLLDTAVGQGTTGARAARTGRPPAAVLPFLNMSSDPDNQFFSDGLAQELIAVLSKVKGLDVAS